MAMKVYEYFKDLWRGGFYTVSTSEGYVTVPTLSDVKVWFKENKKNLDAQSRKKFQRLM